MTMLDDLDKDTVDFRPNYDEKELEPTVLPARFPNLLVNGAGGIAVGMATNIPPHNLGESIDAVLALMDKPDMSVEELMEVLPGPDFPTGGLILGRAGIRAAYSTGRGSIIMRARVHTETLRKDREALIVTEIPYQVNKATLIERIAELVREKKVEGISDLRDESDRDGMRIVIELQARRGRRRRAEPALALHGDADELRRQYGRAQRRPAGNDERCATCWRRSSSSARPSSRGAPSICSTRRATPPTSRSASPSRSPISTR